MIATRNITWSEDDLKQCTDSGIGVLTDGELDYYLQLVKHLKRAARYQFLGHMFGGQKIHGLAKEVIATRGKMGGDTFYTFLIRPDDLLRIAYVGHKASRDIENLETYQRLLQPYRLRKIAKFINDGGKFPTNIVVNLKTRKGTKLRFDKKGRQGDEAWGTLHLPPIYASAWIIDGQHRLYGYAHARQAGGFNRDSTTLPVLAYENLPAEREMDLFININSKQVKVRTALLVELYSDLHWHSSNADQALQALRSRIASRLNSRTSSPLYDRMVVIGKRKTHHRCLTTTSICDGLRHANLIGTLRKNRMIPGPLCTHNADAREANLRKALSVLSNCLGMFSTELADHWELGDAASGYLCTNNGIRALFHVINDITKHIRQDGGTDPSQLDADDLFAAIKPYLEVLVAYFKDASSPEVQGFRRVGSSLVAVRQQAYGMEAQINKTFSDFFPSGLQDYLESRDKAGMEEAAGIVTKIHRRLFDYVIGRLKEHFGRRNKEWWIKGIPMKIRTKCTMAWEEKNRKGEEESNLYLIDYIDICIHNWHLVKDVISLGARDIENKRANTKWIRELNDIRKVTTHPERGVLTTTQVKLVKQYSKKVKKFFPSDEEDL